MQFFTTTRLQIGPIFDPSPLKNADVLNGVASSILLLFNSIITPIWALLLLDGTDFFCNENVNLMISMTAYS